MSIVPVITAVIGFLPGLFKHKPNCLWYWTGEKWDLRAGPMSSRQCRLQMKTYVACGMDPKRFIVLRAGVKPPDGFNPPAGTGAR